MLSQDIARNSPPTVQLWRERFQWPFRAFRLCAAKKVRAMEESPPEWIWCDDFRATVAALAYSHGLKPHLVRTFKVSRDKQFIESRRGRLYLNPP